MPSVFERLFRSAENMYAGAVDSFENKRFYWAEMLSAAASGVTSFLYADHETPGEIRAQSNLLRNQSFILSQQARSAWFHQQAESRLSGPRSGFHPREKDRDAIFGMLEDAVRAASE